MIHPSFEECVQMIRSNNHGIYEDGYHWIQDYLSQHIDDIIELMQREENPDLRAKFVELLGDSENPKVIPYLEQELEHSEREVRYWAYLVLEHFGRPETSKIAEEFRKTNSHEDFF
jgi:HEAT repeat protein